jgi:hypothetical protein|tara:strand:+ start:21 stop:236 length:216 start_codon:yes stop_codon:yes gene_type:complete
MYKVEESFGEQAKKDAASRPFGMGLAKDIADKVEKLEVWGTSFSDPGPDYTEMVAYDAEGTKLATVRHAGY